MGLDNRETVEEAMHPNFRVLHRPSHPPTRKRKALHISKGPAMLARNGNSPTGTPGMRRMEGMGMVVVSNDLHP